MLPKSWLSSEENRRKTVFGLSMLLGALLFVLVYGPYVLNPFYDDWIFLAEEQDPVQHYLGFCLYRSSPWKFPVGLVTTASFPHDMSVIYTDAIPLFAFLGKLLSPILPQVFQYLGIYGLLSMALTGGMGALLIYELTKKPELSIIASVFYSMSWILLYRMFYHTSLTSHWLILTAFYLWIRSDLKEDIRKSCLIYALFSAIAILIHPYIWTMCLGITIVSFIEYLMQKGDLRRLLLYGAVFCGVGAFCLFAFGAFTGGTKADLGAGSYEANLNTLFNSMGYARIPGLPVALQQYEGFGYLGAGGLMLCVAALILSAVKRIRPVITLRKGLLILCALCFTLFCIVPEISWGEKILLKIDLGKVFRTLVGVLRSNGRFIWPVCYLLITWGIVLIIRHMKKSHALILLAACIVLQLADMMPYLIEKHETYASKKYAFSGVLDDNAALEEAVKDLDHIVIDMDDTDIVYKQYLSYYAYLHGMTTNDFYYARPIGDKVEASLNEMREDMSKGIYDDRSLYAIGEDRLSLYKDFDLHFYRIGDRVFASHAPIEGLKEQ